MPQTQKISLHHFPEDLREEMFSHLIDLCTKDIEDASTQLVLKAVHFAHIHHKGQLRKSGEAYIYHPLAAAEIMVKEFKISDPHLLAATILHDIVEDVEYLTIETIETQFGPKVKTYVEGCTKIQLRGLSRMKTTDMTHQKLLIMAGRDPEILLIKLCDRLHNMQTLSALKEKKRQIKSLETLEIYAPLAAKFNLITLKRELYRLAILYKFPKKSKRIKRKLKELEASKVTRDIQARFETEYSKFPCPVKVRARVKNLGAYYSKGLRSLDLKNSENSVDYTIVLETDNPLYCYKALGVINAVLQPQPKSIRDYIASPKLNGYQSLHVRAGYRNQRYLVKIRTKAMDIMARRGILLYWDDKVTYSAMKERIKDVLQQLGQYQGTPADRKRLFRDLPDEGGIYVYTPKGELHHLPSRSIVLDFAYKIHSTLGHTCRYALVNGRKESPSYILKDGETVRIFTSKEPIEVYSELEAGCKTTKARNSVHDLLKEKRTDTALAIGKSILIQELEKFELKEDILTSDPVKHFLAYKGCRNLNDFFTRIGQDHISSRELIWEIRGLHPPDAAGSNPCVSPTDKKSLITISQLERGIHKFSQCCRPLPGIEPVVATVSERGISFHRESCTNFKTKKGFSPDKVLIIKWDMKTNWKAPVLFELVIKGKPISHLLPLLRSTPKDIPIHRIVQVEHKRKPVVNLSVSLAGPKQAAFFFHPFQTQQIELSIKKYSSV